jgi:hypothetical protein
MKSIFKYVDPLPGYMIHINPHLREHGVKGFLLDLMMPQSYFASGIADFLGEKDHIVPSTRSKLIGYMLTLQPGSNHLVDKAAISVFSIEYCKVDSYTALLRNKNYREDLGIVSMIIHDPLDRYNSDVEQGMDRLGFWYRVDYAGFIFDPKKPVSQAELVAVRRRADLPKEPLCKANIYSYVQVMA